MDLFEQYQDLLKLFYRKATKKHFNKSELNTQLLKKLSQWNNQFVQQQDSSKNLLKTPAKSNKSACSQESVYSKNQLKQQEKQEKYFNCQWIFKHNNFKKVFSYAIIYNIINNDDSYSFTKVSQQINDIISSKSDQKQLTEIGQQWSKIIQTFNKKHKVRWTKILSQIFLNFPDYFINIIFQVISKEKSNTKINITLNYIADLSRKAKININYFIINFRNLEIWQKTQGYKDQLYIGFIKEEEKYVFTNKLPKKNQEETNKQTVTSSLSDAIQNLLKEYQSNTQKLLNLELLMDSKNQKKKI